jgi:hypothetical protein
MCLRRHCPARASPEQSCSISELQAERTFPLLLHEETPIDAITSIEASNPHLAKLFKSRLDISALQVVVRSSDDLVGSCGSGMTSLFYCRLTRVSPLVESRVPQDSRDGARARLRQSDARRSAAGYSAQASPLRQNQSGLAYLSYNPRDLPRLRLRRILVH